MILKIIILQLLILYNLKCVCCDVYKSSNYNNLNDPKIQMKLTMKQINNRRISDIKCEEYDAMTRNMTRSKDCNNCGMLLVSNGQIADTDEFPHMVAIGWIRTRTNDSIEYLCAGSLISDRWVLTSAHCTHNKIGYPKVVKLGSNNLNEDSGEIFKIIDIIGHPKFKPPHLYNDIALLKLERIVTFKNNIKPACLYNKFETAPPALWATGWGSKQNDSYNPSNKLMKVKLNVIDNISCSLAYNHTNAAPNGTSPSMICAGDLLNGWKSDTCKGDSGGPLQIYHDFDNNNSLFDIVGITSFGKLCAVENIPGVYTRVSHYISWIEQIVWLNSYY